MLDDERIPDDRGDADRSTSAAALPPSVRAVPTFCSENGLTFGDDIAASASGGPALQWIAVDFRSPSSDRACNGEDPEDSPWRAGFQLLILSKALSSNDEAQDPQVVISAVPRKAE